MQAGPQQQRQGCLEERGRHHGGCQQPNSNAKVGPPVDDLGDWV